MTQIIYESDSTLQCVLNFFCSTGRWPRRCMRCESEREHGTEPLLSSTVLWQAPYTEYTLNMVQNLYCPAQYCDRHLILSIHWTWCRTSTVQPSTVTGTLYWVYTDHGTEPLLSNPVLWQASYSEYTLNMLQNLYCPAQHCDRHLIVSIHWTWYRTSTVQHSSVTGIL